MHISNIHEVNRLHGELHYHRKLLNSVEGDNYTRFTIFVQSHSTEARRHGEMSMLKEVIVKAIEENIAEIEEQLHKLGVSTFEKEKTDG